MEQGTNAYSKNDAPKSALSVTELAGHAKSWIQDGEIRQFSRHTLRARRMVIDRLLWFLGQREAPVCGARELRAFLAYVAASHETDGGRWGNPKQVAAARPATTHLFYRNLETFANWLVEDEVLDVSPMARIKAPIVRSDQVQPFTTEQLQALLSAARRTRSPRRDLAILLLLLDTGMRASELCGLRVGDYDNLGRRCTVIGKGNKRRTLPIQRETRRAIWGYLRRRDVEPAEPLFIAERGRDTDEGLTIHGLGQLIKRLGQEAKISGVRCSPHTFRHTFALFWLMAGGDPFTLQTLLGHNSPAMTQHYVKLAQADLETQHQRFSPVAKLFDRHR